MSPLLLVHGPRDRRRRHLHRGADNFRKPGSWNPPNVEAILHTVFANFLDDVAAHQNGHRSGRAVRPVARRPPAALLPRPAPGVYCARGAVGAPHAAAPRGERLVIGPVPLSLPCPNEDVYA